MAHHDSQPPVGDTDSSRVELLSDQNQRLISYGALLGSIMLALQHIAIGAHFPGWATIATTVTSLIGWTVFAAGIWKSMRLKRTPEGRAFMEDVARDERLVAIRSRAFEAGFFAMMGVQVVLLVLIVVVANQGAHWLSVSVAAPVTIAAGVAGAVLRFQILMSR